MTLLRTTIALLVLSSGCTVQIAGSGNANACSGDFCVDISSSFYSYEPCPSMPGMQCKFANVYFTAKNKGVSITNLDAGSVELSINGRPAGVESDSSLTTSNGLVVQLLLDRSFSITESGSTSKVQSGASTFIRGLSSAALVSVSMFASEEELPWFLNQDGTSSTTTQILYDKVAAEDLVQRFYRSYPSLTSDAKTKLYDAVGKLASQKPQGNSASKLQTVMVVFTDGADTASKNFTQPNGAGALRNYLGNTAPDLKVYAIGLGKEPDAEALGVISNNRFYKAANADDLQKAFAEVSKELTAIYLFKYLDSAGVEDRAAGRLKVSVDGQVVDQTFQISSYTASTSGTQSADCKKLFTCMKAVGSSTASWESGYGTSGSCWTGTAKAADSCSATCREAAASYKTSYPSTAACQ